MRTHLGPEHAQDEVGEAVDDRWLTVESGRGVHHAKHSVPARDSLQAPELALQAAEELEKTGISAEVIDLRSLRPFDVEAVAESVKKTNRIVSVEEGWPFAAIGSEIAAIVMEECFDWLDAPLKRVAGKDVPLPYAANL